MSKNRENLYKISNGLYLVTTQSGFNKCVKILSREGYNKGFPKSYPSVVSSYDCYKGYFLTVFVCTPIEEYVFEKQNIINDIKNTIKMHKVAK